MLSEQQDTMAKRKKTPAKQLSGGARLKAAGRHPQLLGWEPDEWAIILEAAAREKRAATQFVQYHALEAAKKIIGK